MKHVDAQQSVIDIDVESSDEDKSCNNNNNETIKVSGAEPVVGVTGTGRAGKSKYCIVMPRRGDKSAGGGAANNLAKNDKAATTTASTTNNLVTRVVRKLGPRGKPNANNSYSAISSARMKRRKGGVLEEGMYLVDKIVDKRIDPDGTIKYFIKWKGYASQNTWEPEENISSTLINLYEYEISEEPHKKQIISNRLPEFLRAQMISEDFDKLKARLQETAAQAVETVQPNANGSEVGTGAEAELSKKSSKASSRANSMDSMFENISNAHSYPSSIAEGDGGASASSDAISNICGSTVANALLALDARVDNRSPTPSSCPSPTSQTEEEGTIKLNELANLENMDKANGNGSVSSHHHRTQMEMDGVQVESGNSTPNSNQARKLFGSQKPPYVKYDPNEGFRIIQTDGDVRGRQVREIIANAVHDGKNLFLVHFEGSSDYAVVNACEMNSAFPQQVIHYYQERITWFTREEALKDQKLRGPPTPVKKTQKQRRKRKAK